YLVAYNLFSMVSWAWILYLTCAHLLTTGSPQTLYPVIGYPLTVIQTLMFLDPLHSALGLVRSPLLTNLVQVASRIIVVWQPLQLFNVPAVTTSWALATMTIAWGVTEVVRYGYYVFNLLGMQPYPLTWARYTFFYVLYPVGATSEAVLIYHALDAAKAFSPLIYYIMCLEIFLYVP
ncbi:tyrosine phosphatase-like protein, partial [Dimargaris cristalligena]